MGGTARKGQVGQFLATAICGNDLASSCLYTTGLSAAAAGVWAPVGAILVVVMLHFFRTVYEGTARVLPYNGGAYSLLLHTTTKQAASLAACLTVLSYVATAVVAAAEASDYLHQLLPAIDVWSGALCLLGVCAVLNVIGLSESAVVAACIFLLHVSCLALLLCCCLVHLFTVPEAQLHLQDNAQSLLQPPAWQGLFSGFSAAALGISGFESAANFVEEQRPGDFPRTLRNLWFLAALFNPTLSFMSVTLLPLEDTAQYRDVFVARLASVTGGPWLERLISANAALVLSGAVLTAFVGVTGLIRRVASDGALPHFLVATNTWRGTAHWIPVLFGLVCASMYVLLHGQVASLAAVYSLAFLGLMALFAVGHILLHRARIPRSHASDPDLVTLLPVTVTLGEPQGHTVVECTASSGSTTIELVRTHSRTVSQGQGQSAGAALEPVPAFSASHPGPSSANLSHSYLALALVLIALTVTCLRDLVAVYYFFLYFLVTALLFGASAVRGHLAAWCASSFSRTQSSSKL